MSFSASSFFYLNPELWTWHEKTDEIQPENALRLFKRYNSPDTPLHTTMPDLPADFDPEVFILSAGRALDIASINRHIRRSATENGNDDVWGTFLPTIKQGIHIIASSSSSDTERVIRFGLDDPFFELSERVLVSGDIVRIELSTHVCGMSCCRYDGEVTHVDYTNHTFDVSKLPRSFFESESCPSSGYCLYGQKLYDTARVAIINYTRGARPFENDDVSKTKNFNAGLYRMLYPDSTALSDAEAFLDFRGRRANGDKRIGDASDMIVDDLSATNELSAMNRVKLEWTSNQTRNILDKCQWSSNSVGKLTQSVAVTYATRRDVVEDVRGLQTSLDALTTSSVAKNSMGDVFIEGNLFVEKKVELYSQLTIDAGEITKEPMLDVRGSVRARDFVVSSDKRIKKNVCDLDGDRCLKLIDRMRVVEYGRHKHTRDDESYYGFIAQELADLDPNLVSQSTDFVPNILMELMVSRSGFLRVPIAIEIGTRIRLLSRKKNDQWDEIIVTIRAVDGEEGGGGGGGGGEGGGGGGEGGVYVDGGGGGGGVYVDDVGGRVYGRTHLVYGTEVNDFLSVRYNHLMAIVVSGMQQMHRNVQAGTSPSPSTSFGTT